MLMLAAKIQVFVPRHSRHACHSYACRDSRDASFWQGEQNNSNNSQQGKSAQECCHYRQHAPNTDCQCKNHKFLSVDNMPLLADGGCGTQVERCVCGAK
jgi:hypothetical protein